LTSEERVQRLQALEKRIHLYVRLMCQAGSLNGTSAEAKERALAAFYEHLVVAERQLGRIHDELQLG